MKITKLCNQCSKPMDKHGVYCKVCVKLKERESRDKYLKNKIANKICHRCSKPTYRNRWLCKECSELRIKQHKAVIDYRKANNLCTKCNTPITGIYSTCASCRNKQNIYSKNYAYKKAIRKYFGEEIKGVTT